jgi:hypothetical protein
MPRFPSVGQELLDVPLPEMVTLCISLQRCGAMRSGWKLVKTGRSQPRSVV